MEAKRRRCDGFKVEELVEQKAFSRKVMGSFWHGTTRAHNVGTLHHKKNVGQIDLGRCRKCQAWNGRQVATRDAVQRMSSSFCGTALTCALEEEEQEGEGGEGAIASSILCGDIRRLGKICRDNSWEMAKPIVWAGAKVRECYN